MAGTAKPLNIIVSLNLQCPEIKELIDKGHNVHFMGDQLNEADLIIGPNCWRMHKGLLKHLGVAIKGARQLKYANQTSVVTKKTRVTRKKKGKVEANNIDLVSGTS